MLLQLYQKFDTIEVEKFEKCVLQLLNAECKNYSRLYECEILTPWIPLVTDTRQFYVGSPDDCLRKTLRTAEYEKLFVKVFLDLWENHERWLKALMLIYADNLSQKEAASQMGIKVETLYSILHRAKVWIKVNYGTEYDKISQL